MFEERRGEGRGGVTINTHHRRVVSIQSLADERVASSGGDESKGRLGAVTSLVVRDNVVGTHNHDHT